MLKGIKSKYILEIIFGFIKDKKKKKLKLFVHSKYFQNLFGLSLYNFQKEYLHSLKNYNNYYNDYLCLYSIYSEKSSLSDKYNEYIKSLNNIPTDVIERDISDLIYKNSEIYSQSKIDIYSPLFFSFINNKSLTDKLSINIPLNLIIKNNLEDDYIKLFKELNNNSHKYQSISISFYKDNDLDLLDKLNIIFSNIKYLCFKDNSIIHHDNDTMSIKLLNNKDLQSNLILLNIDLNFTYHYFFESILISKFNNLKFLILNNINFAQDAIINIKDMEYLMFTECNNITLNSTSNTSNIRILYIYNTKINNEKKEIKFPFLKKLIYYAKEKNININFFDFNSLKNLKYLESFSEIFIKLFNSPLEKIEIKETDNFNINILSQLATINTIKKAELKNINIEKELISDIKGVNNNLINLSIKVNGKINNCNFEKITKNFPNLKAFNFDYINKKKILNNDINDIRIKENNNCEINDLEIRLFHSEFGKLLFYINSYSTLKILNLEGLDLNENIFPIFNNKCNIMFSSLKSLILSENNISIDIFDNIINNIKNCPALEFLGINEKSLDITKEKYFENIKKLLLTNISKIKIQIVRYRCCFPPGFYSKKDLKTIFGNINENKRYYFQVYHSFN